MPHPHQLVHTRTPHILGDDDGAGDAKDGAGEVGFTVFVADLRSRSGAEAGVARARV